MNKSEHRSIFQEDFTEFGISNLSLGEIEEKYCLCITNDRYFPIISAKKLEEIKKSISACIYLAISTNAEIAVEVSENQECLSVYLASKEFHFNVADLISLSYVCNSSMDITILPNDDISGKALICINFNLSDKKYSIIDRFL